jgi:hypothetical protein
MPVSENLCPHLASPALTELRIAAADILEWRDAPVLAIVRCDRCDGLGLVELLEWDRPRDVRTYALSSLDPKAAAIYLRDVERGSCDPNRLAKEREALLVSAGPVERRVRCAP